MDRVALLPVLMMRRNYELPAAVPSWSSLSMPEEENEGSGEVERRKRQSVIHCFNDHSFTVLCGLRARRKFAHPAGESSWSSLSMPVREKKQKRERRRRSQVFRRFPHAFMLLYGLRHVGILLFQMQSHHDSLCPCRRRTRRNRRSKREGRGEVERRKGQSFLHCVKDYSFTFLCGLMTRRNFALSSA